VASGALIHHSRRTAGLTALVVLAGLLGAAWLYLPLPNSPGRPSDGERHVVHFDAVEHVYYDRGAGPVVVLLPSLGRPASDFNELTAALSAAGYRTIAIDLNIRRVSSAESENTLFSLADSIDLVISALGLNEGERVFVIGHAFGNRLARAYATSHRERVQSVILLAAGGRVPIDADVLAALSACFDPVITRAARLRALRYAFFAQSSSIPPHWRIGWDRSLAKIQVRANETTPYQEWWDAGGVPLLVIQADEDSIAPAVDTSQLLKTDFGSRVQVAIASPAGHALLPERPDFIADTIIAHLDAVQSGTAQIGDIR